MIVAEGQAPSVSDHTFNTEHIIISVNHRMNITSYAWGYIYSDGGEGGWCVYVAIQYATFDPSSGINHSAKLLHVMRTSIDTNESLFPLYLVGLEIDGGSDHNHKHW